MMPRFEDAYPGLFSGWWKQQPEDFGLSLHDAPAEVCELCTWGDCDKCRFSTDEWAESGPPPLALVLDGENYYETLPTHDDKRDVEAEEPETVEFVYGAVVKSRMGSVQIIPTTFRTIADADDHSTDAQVTRHRAFQYRDEEDVMAGETLIVYVDGGNKPSTGMYGSAIAGYRGKDRKFEIVHRFRRRYSAQVLSDKLGVAIPPTNNTAEWASFTNALRLAQMTLDEMAQREEPPEFDTVEIKVDSMLVQGQMVKGWRCKAPHLQAIREVARRERDGLLAALRQRSGSATLRVTHISGDEMKRVLGH